jgi:polyphosphate glucokinase
MPKITPPNRILSVDIGGSYVKATILDKQGKLVTDYEKKATPVKPPPKQLLSIIEELAKELDQFDCISVGFPGYVKNGVVMTAPNLGTEQWANVDFRKMVEDALGKPTQLLNDADMQGLGVVSGKGLEMVITLGTGFGTALVMDGTLLPHLEIAHHPVTKNKDYDQFIGDIALEKKGPEEWNKRMEYVLQILKTVFNYDTLYIGGGNAKLLTMTLDKNIKIINNRDGIKGGARLWFPLDTKK